MRSTLGRAAAARFSGGGARVIEEQLGREASWPSTATPHRVSDGTRTGGRDRLAQAGAHAAEQARWHHDPSLEHPANRLSSTVPGTTGSCAARVGG